MVRTTDFTDWPWRQGQAGNQPIAEHVEMTTIIQDRFDSGAQVSLEMDKSEGELFVFHCPAGQGCKVSKWPLDSYHMPIAMAHYEQCLELERAAFEACSTSA
jgi:transposase